MYLAWLQDPGLLFAYFASQLPLISSSGCSRSRPSACLGRDGRTLVVMLEAGSLNCDTLNNVTAKQVHDAHDLGQMAHAGVHLLQHSVDIDGVLLDICLLALVTAFLDPFLGIFLGN